MNDSHTLGRWLVDSARRHPGKVAIAVQMAKGLVTDSEPDLGDNDTVTL